MKTEQRQLPVGIQSFEKIRENQCLYVDKTEYVYRLVHTNNPFFLSRPRRFGKSLLLSTMKAYWEGRKDLFRGLKIMELEADDPNAWEVHPVFYFDFNKADFKKAGALEAVLLAHLQEWEALYGKTDDKAPLGVRFGLLLRTAAEQTGKKAVVLVDEYDKALLETMDDKELVEQSKATFKGFFSVLKSYDAYIQFIFITGVTKFSKVSIFSDLNQLRDISMVKEYAELCGITEDELKATFTPEIDALAEEQEINSEECLIRLRNTYDGYQFHEKGTKVYNPYSLLTAFADREFGSYWFATGTPTFLVNRLKSIHFDVRKFTDGTLYATKRMLTDYRDDNPDPIPLLYQTGYLTIADYEPTAGSYTLKYPNEEVKYGFLDCLMPAYVDGVGAGSGKDVLSIKSYVESGDPDRIRDAFTALFASIPYTTDRVPFEHDFQTVIYITLTLLGQFVKCESHTYMGRIDCVLETKNYVYIFEFKRDSSPEEALKQIEDMHYADPYAAFPGTVYKIGVNFDSETRQLAGWKAELAG